MKKFGDLTLFRFIIAGGLNTGLTYAIYLVLLHFVPYIYAYTATFATGIAMGYFLNAKFVYRTNAKFNTAISYLLIYLFNYFLGASLLYVSIELFDISEYMAPIVVVAISVPIMYFLTHKLFFAPVDKSGTDTPKES